jgi:hypothetical protein
MASVRFDKPSVSRFKVVEVHHGGTENAEGARSFEI